MQNSTIYTSLLTALCFALLFAGCDDDDNGNGPGDNNPTTLVEMVSISAGTFQMGSDRGFDRAREEPVHQVTLSKDFLLGKYEITQKQWTDIMGSNPSKFQGDDLPVDSVDWFAAVEFCNKLSESENLTPAYTINGTDVQWNPNANGYRLPTEAEWEYACRAGTQTDFYTGNVTVLRGDDPNLTPIAWYRTAIDAEILSRKVGQKQPNDFGLYDMLGNVSEWCWDFAADYSLGAVTDPAGPDTGDRKISRGGSMATYPENARCAKRLFVTITSRSHVNGFRIARNRE